MVDDAPRILGGRYEVGELIGRGGMAEVHIGHDTRLGRTVAIKILRSDLARDPSFQARFRREAQAAASLNHPAIVAVYDTGEDVFTEPTGGGVAHVPFIVMEYVEGHTVRDILRDGAAVPIEEAVEITTGVLSALEYSHHAGIVHRDIKPANVMLTPTGAVKVMDFGIARAMADAAGTMTQTQAVIGTAQYLSPEQARGEQVDARSDLYSTGCLLFELLTGRPPFIGDSPVAVAYQHAREEAQPPSTFASDVPDGLDRIAMKALAKDRDQRYSTAAEFRSELEAAVRGGHINAPAVGALGAAAFGAGALGAGAAGLGGGPATAATQVIGAGISPTQVVPAVGPWAQVGAEPSGPPARSYPEPEDEPNRRWVVWTLVVIAVAAIVGILWLLTQGDPAGPSDPTTVTLKDLTGMEQSLAQDEIEALDLTYKPLTEASADVAKGHVIRTNPGPGEVPVNSTVEVAISSGPDAVTIPTLTNFTQVDARATLEGFGFDEILTRTEDNPSVLKDAVIGTEPAAGESVAPSTPITLILSTGQVQLPDLTGKLEAEARQILVDLRLIPTITQEESDETVGTVIKQSRTPGPVPQGADVTLTIAIERAPEQVAVPDVLGMEWPSAQNMLGSYNLNAEKADEPDATIAEGLVIRTEPGAGTNVDEGSTVRVIVSSGPDPAAPGTAP